MDKPKFLYLIIILIFIYSACTNSFQEDNFGQVGLKVENQLNNQIDTFNFHFETSIGVDSIGITGLSEDHISSTFFYVDIKYHFREKGDIFFITKGRFVIEGQIYYLSNCFCDPDLETDVISDGTLTVLLENIDKARANVEYRVIKK